MTNSSSRLTNRLIILVSVITFLAPLILFILNISNIYRGPLQEAKKSIEAYGGAAISKKIYIEKLDFVAYKGFVLNDLRIYNEDQELDLQVEKLVVRFKLFKFLKDRFLDIECLEFIKPRFYTHPQNLIVAPEDKEIIPGCSFGMHKNFTIKIKDGLFLQDESRAVVDTAGEASGIGFSFFVRLQDENKLRAGGILDLSEYASNEYPLSDMFFPGVAKKLRFRLDLSWDSDRLYIKRLLLSFKHFKLSVKGNISDYKRDPTANLTLALKEVVFRKGLSLGEHIFINRISGLILHMKAAGDETDWSITLDNVRGRVMLLPMPISIDKLSCDLRHTKDGVSIKNTNFFLNDVPIGVVGKAIYSEPPYLEIKILSHPGQITSLRRSNPFNFKLSFSGHDHRDYVKGDLFFELEKLRSARRSDEQHFTFKVSDLVYRPKGIQPDDTDDTPALLIFKTGNFIYSGNMPWEDAHLQFSGSEFLIDTTDNKLRFEGFKLSGYGGSIDGTGTVFFHNTLLDSYFDITLNSLRIPDFKEIFPIGFDISGELGGNITLDNQRIPYLDARIGISNGKLKNVNLINSIADFLGVSTIKDVDFDEITSSFLFFKAGNEIYIKETILNSEKMQLSGDFKIADNLKIDGNILMRLPADVLKESYKMRYILSLAEEKLPHADFEFIVTGNSNSPRIRWLDSKFKQLLVSVISESDKEAMELEIEKALEPFFAK